MKPARFETLAAAFPRLRVAIIGDFCLDRYLEIDFSKREISLETGLPVYNVVNVRPQPGGAGTLLNNLCALGVGEIHLVGFAGEDGEGWELCRALRAKPGVKMDHFIQTPDRHTFTYTKPLVITADKPPKIVSQPKKAPTGPPNLRVKPGRQPTELNRLDFKNWTETPKAVADRLVKSVKALAGKVDAFILLDQVDIPDTGVLSQAVLDAIGDVSRKRPKLLIMADSRCGLRRFPPVTFKMNGVELESSLGTAQVQDLQAIHEQARKLAQANGQRVFVTLSECGIVGAAPTGEMEHAPALPVRGEIDIVGAGDAVTANLVASLLAGATLRESLEIANAAASIVIHQLGTTGTASVKQIKELLGAVA